MSPRLPSQCDALEGFRVQAVAAGVGFTLVLTSAEDKDKVAKLPVFESTAPEEAAVAEEEEAGEEWRVRGEFTSGASTLCRLVVCYDLEKVNTASVDNLIALTLQVPKAERASARQRQASRLPRERRPSNRSGDSVGHQLLEKVHVSKADL